MSGFFGDDNSLNFEIELIGNDGIELPVDAMLDTGFSYWLAIDNQDIHALNWVRL
jgi:predicted aspartyl protease